MKMISRMEIRDLILDEMFSVERDDISYLITESEIMRDSGYSQSDINVFIFENIITEESSLDGSAFVQYLKKKLSQLVIEQIVDNVPGIARGGFFSFLIGETVPAIIMNTSWEHLKLFSSGEGAEPFADILVDSLGDVLTGRGLTRFGNAMGLEPLSEITSFLATGLANAMTEGANGAAFKASIASNIRAIDLSDMLTGFSGGSLLSLIPDIEFPETDSMEAGREEK